MCNVQNGSVDLSMSMFHMKNSWILTSLQSVMNPPGTSLGSSGFLCLNLQHQELDIKFETNIIEYNQFSVHN